MTDETLLPRQSDKIINEKSDITELTRQQNSRLWTDNCGNAHLQRIIKYQSLIEKIDALKVINIPIEAAVQKGQAVILDFLPYNKQVRVRAAVEAGGLDTIQLTSHTFTLVFDKNINSNIFSDNNINNILARSPLHFLSSYMKLNKVLSS